MATAVRRKKEDTQTGKTISLLEVRKRQEMVRNIFSYIVLSLVSLFFVIPLIFTISTALKLPKDTGDGLIVPKAMINPVMYNFFGTKEENGQPITDEMIKEKGWNIPSPYDGALFAPGVDKETKLPMFARWYINSIIVAGAITFLQLVLCSLAAYAFARLKWPGRDKVFLAYLGTMMVPGQVTMIPVFIMMKNFGIIDSYLAVLLPGAFSAYGTFMLRQYFMSIPAALEEAAVIDGANKLQVLQLVIFPLSKTALSTLAIFTFLYSWNDFMWPMIVLHSDSLKTLPIGLQSFLSAYGSQWHLLMAGSLIALVPVIIIFCFGQKFITKGIMMTGIK